MINPSEKSVSGGSSTKVVGIKDTGSGKVEVVLKKVLSNALQGQSIAGLTVSANNTILILLDKIAKKGETIAKKDTVNVGSFPIDSFFSIPLAKGILPKHSTSFYAKFVELKEEMLSAEDKKSFKDFSGKAIEIPVSCNVYSCNENKKVDGALKPVDLSKITK